MNTFSAKTITLTALITCGVLMSSTAHAAILRSSNGTPVLTKDGNCVITNWEGSEGCAMAKEAAGVGANDASCDQDRDTEKTVYFDFNKSALTTEARHHLDHLAKKLRMWHEEDHRHVHHHDADHHQKTIAIVGYADRLGNANYNEKLALKRAEAVRAYLVSKGAVGKNTKIKIRSLGSTEARADCPADMPRAKLIDCLRPDRRVEIEVDEHK